jgi:hypothetical protein
VQEARATSFTDTPAPTPEPAPVAFDDAADEPGPVVAPQPEEVEPNDLDIPAFLRPRKRIF